MSYKSIIFYSNYPHDRISAKCLAEINNNEALKGQFLTICVHHPQNCNIPTPIRLPKIVQTLREKNLIPVLAVAGFKKPILAHESLSWLQESATKAQNGGVDAANINGNGIADNSVTIAQAENMLNEFFQNEYNLSFADGRGETGKTYSNIDESSENRIMTFDDVSTKKRAGAETERRLNMIKEQRNNDTPQSRRVGGVGASSQFGQAPPTAPAMPNMHRGPMMPPNTIGRMSGGGGPMPPGLAPISTKPERQQAPSLQYNPTGVHGFNQHPMSHQMPPRPLMNMPRAPQMPMRRSNY